jgi:hypothetical protein
MALVEGLDTGLTAEQMWGQLPGTVSFMGEELPLGSELFPFAKRLVEEGLKFVQIGKRFDQVIVWDGRGVCIMDKSAYNRVVGHETR